MSALGAPAAGRMAIGALPLEAGGALPGVEVAYHTWGRLDANGSNAVLVCHALTGTADVEAWWPGLIGAGRALDPAEDFIVCSNVLGSCYGTTGPTSARPGTSNSHWGPAFPQVGIRDMVHAQAALLERLGVTRLRLVIGGSMGGMQALEWAVLYPERVGAIAPVGAGPRHAAWAIGLNAVQRQAIREDPAFRDGWYPLDQPPAKGLAMARMVAMLSYRSPSSFERRFGQEQRPDGCFQVASYLRHHGRKLVGRFDANSYLRLSRAMNEHDLGRDRGGVTAVLGRIEQPVLVVAIQGDLLYPESDLRAMADRLPAGELAHLASQDGHDGFLIETEALDALLLAFRRRTAARAA